MPQWKWWLLRSARLLWRWFRIGKLINSVRRWAPFLANLRIQWINLVSSEERMPATI
jgi:hypothetical protein